MELAVGRSRLLHARLFELRDKAGGSYATFFSGPGSSPGGTGFDASASD